MIIAIDTETYNYDEATGEYIPILNARRFVLGCAMTDTGKVNYFYDNEKMWEWIKEQIDIQIARKKRVYIYAHNMEYDWYAIAKNHLLEEDIKYVCFNPFIAIYKQKAYFLDTMSFYRMSLKRVGDIIGLPKMELPTNPTSLEEIKPYLLRDTSIVLQSILRLKEEINHLGFNPRKLLTAGQLAITSFLTFIRRQKQDWDLLEYNEEKKLMQVIKTKYPTEIREAFRGGTCISFQLGKFNNVTLIDVNAEYAMMMKKMEFPNLKTEQKLTPTIGLLTKYLPEYIGVARVTIKSPIQELPYLPIRYLKYTVYPSDRIMRGTWTFLELQQALQLGYEIINIEWAIRWKKAKINPFKDFITYLYDLEKSKKTSDEKLPIKIIRNNLYGKFAQYKRNKDYKIISRQELPKYIEKGYQPLSSMEDKYVCEKYMDIYDPSYTNPIISCMITANARLFLWKQLKKLPAKDRLYCDTDSIAFKGFHVNKYDIGTNMGQWKIEAQGIGKFLGEKRYYVQDRAKISGLMRREISTSIIDKEQDVTTKRMIGLKTALKAGNLHEVGLFNEEKIEMRPHNKIQLYLPEIIDEVKQNENELLAKETSNTPS